VIINLLIEMNYLENTALYSAIASLTIPSASGVKALVELTMSA